MWRVSRRGARDVRAEAARALSWSMLGRMARKYRSEGLFGLTIWTCWEVRGDGDAECIDVDSISILMCGLIVMILWHTFIGYCCLSMIKCPVFHTVLTELRFEKNEVVGVSRQSTTFF